MESETMIDVVIIGAGIIGSLIAYELSKYELNVTIVDKENDIANQSSMANSAIIHGGFDPLPGSLKAKLNLVGKQLYEDLCHNLKVSYKKIGSLTVATSEEEIKVLETLNSRAKENGVNIDFISGDEVRKLEPHLSTNIIKGLLCEDTAIVYPWEVAIAAMEVAIHNGVMLKLNTEVQSILKVRQGYEIKTNQGMLQTKLVINAAGVFGDDIGRMINPNLDLHIKPGRGTYFVLDKEFNKVSRVIYPTPTEKGKGVLMVPTINGNTLLGPDYEVIDDKENTETTMEAYEYIKDQLLKIFPEFPASSVICSFTGLRAKGNYNDFYIQPDSSYETFIHVIGIDSPGLSAAPAIATYVLQFIKPHIKLVEKDWDLTRQPVINLKNLSREEKNEWIKNNPAYGRIICRCEQITEGEIVDCIKRFAGATTVKGVKKRCRPGMGKCQGSFCEPYILKILGRELDKNLDEVFYDEHGTNVLIEPK